MGEVPRKNLWATDSSLSAGRNSYPCNAIRFRSLFVACFVGNQTTARKEVWKPVLYLWYSPPCMKLIQKAAVQCLPSLVPALSGACPLSASSQGDKSSPKLTHLLCLPLSIYWWGGLGFSKRKGIPSNSQVRFERPGELCIGHKWVWLWLKIKWLCVPYTVFFRKLLKWGRDRIWAFFVPSRLSSKTNKTLKITSLTRGKPISGPRK